MRLAVTGGGAGGGVEAFATGAACFGFATAAALEGVTEVGWDAVIVVVTVSAGWSESASEESGNQKSRSCQSAMLRASSSRQRDPSINLRCLESWAELARGFAGKGRPPLGTILFVSISKSDILGRRRLGDGRFASMPRKRPKGQQKMKWMHL